MSLTITACSKKKSSSVATAPVTQNDDDNNTNFNGHRCRHDHCYCSNTKDDESFGGAVDHIALTSGCTNRMTRVTKGLELFISAVIVIALTIYMVQKSQQRQPQLVSLLQHQPIGNFHVHTKLNDESSSFWRWHCK